MELLEEMQKTMLGYVNSISIQRADGAEVDLPLSESEPDTEE